MQIRKCFLLNLQKKKCKIYLFVDGRYHIQAEQEIKEGIEVVKLQLGQKQDEEIRKLLNPRKTLGIVAKKVSQARLEGFKGFKIKLLNVDPINNYTESHQAPFIESFSPKEYKFGQTTFISNLEEVSYLTGYRDFTKDYSSKIWAKMVINGDLILFGSTSDLKSSKRLLSEPTPSESCE